VKTLPELDGDLYHIPATNKKLMTNQEITDYFDEASTIAKIRYAAKNDPALREMLDQLIVFYKLKYSDIADTLKEEWEEEDDDSELYNPWWDDGDE